MISKINRSFNSHVVNKILKTRSPEEFIIELAIGLLLKSYTEIIMKPHKSIMELHRYIWLIMEPYAWITGAP